MFTLHRLHEPIMVYLSPSIFLILNPLLIHLRLTKIHLRMLLHKLLQHILFLLLITRWLALFLLALIIHHLLDHASRLPIQISQFAILGLDLGNIDFGGGRYDVCPPFELVDFV